MSSSVPVILSVSYDESLLHTRRWILETAGFTVVSVLGFTEAVRHLNQGTFAVLIIGHSIPREDKASLFRMARARPGTKVVVLQRTGESEIPGADCYLDIWEGPEALISTIRKVLGCEQDDAAGPKSDTVAGKG